MIICGPPDDWCDPPSDLIICGPPEWCDHPSDVITWPMGPAHTMRLLEKRCGTTHVDDDSYCLCANQTVSLPGGRWCEGWPTEPWSERRPGNGLLGQIGTAQRRRRERSPVVTCCHCMGELGQEHEDPEQPLPITHGRPEGWRVCSQCVSIILRHDDWRRTWRYSCTRGGSQHAQAPLLLTTAAAATTLVN